MPLKLSTLTIVTTFAALGALESGCATGKKGEAIARYDRLPQGAYAVVAEVRAKPGRADQLRAATLPLVEDVRREPKNLLYFLHEDLQAPGHFVFYEIFAADTDFEAHNRTSHVQAWFDKLPELADGRVRVIRMQVLGN